MPVDTFYQAYKDNGFNFSDEILNRYALSLATKPFVILSGISGTGKTKIAQLFSPPIDESGTGGDVAAVLAEERDYITMTVTEGLTNGDGRANFRFADVPNIISNEDFEARKIEIERILESGEGERNIGEPIRFTILGLNGEEITMVLYLQRASSPLVRVRAKSKRGDADPYNSMPYFANNFEIGDVLQLVKVRDNVLKIATVNDVEVIDVAQKQRTAELFKVNNQCFIPVRSNWTDSSELMGYYNQITGQYVVTEFLRFILKAKDYPELPFFLILDEMNLSKVEHYFSDYLSCLESRRLENGCVKQEKISLYSGQDLIQTNDEEYDLIQSKIEIPLNLYVTGTVNIDDSTYMFSPKVLDRANVIEFNEVVLNEEAEPGVRLSVFPHFGEPEIATIKYFSLLREASQRRIQGVLSKLKLHNQHFGYRTIAEISLYILNSNSCIEDTDENEKVALDIQILQKVLPKFSGSFAKLSEPIKSLIHYLSDSEVDLGEFGLEQAQNIDLPTTEFPLSLAKLVIMYTSVSLQGFASYIE